MDEDLSRPEDHPHPDPGLIATRGRFYMGTVFFRDQRSLLPGKGKSRPSGRSYKRMMAWRSPSVSGTCSFSTSTW